MWEQQQHPSNPILFGCKINQPLALLLSLSSHLWDTHMLSTSQQNASFHASCFIPAPTAYLGISWLLPNHSKHAVLSDVNVLSARGIDNRVRSCWGLHQAFAHFCRSCRISLSCDRKKSISELRVWRFATALQRFLPSVHRIRIPCLAKSATMAGASWTSKNTMLVCAGSTSNPRDFKPVANLAAFSWSSLWVQIHTSKHIHKEFHYQKRLYWLYPKKEPPPSPEVDQCDGPKHTALQPPAHPLDANHLQLLSASVWLWKWNPLILRARSWLWKPCRNSSKGTTCSHTWDFR